MSQSSESSVTTSRIYSDSFFRNSLLLWWLDLFLTTACHLSLIIWFPTIAWIVIILCSIELSLALSSVARFIIWAELIKIIEHFTAFGSFITGNLTWSCIVTERLCILFWCHGGGSPPTESTTPKPSAVIATTPEGNRSWTLCLPCYSWGGHIWTLCLPWHDHKGHPWTLYLSGKGQGNCPGTLYLLL